MNISITKNEKKALIEHLTNGNPCRHGCTYKEMEKSKKDCDECPLITARNSLIEKLEK